MWIADAPAGKRNKNKVPTPEPVEKPKPKREKSTPAFTGPLPIGSGPIPKGLANLSAQGCSACHYDSHADWAGSAHATGWSRPAFTEAIATAADPACTNCHLPLLEQRAILYATSDEGVEKSTGIPNPAFSATLRTEGVTCAACHVREGTVLSARPSSERGKAPHPVAWSKDLADGTICSTCHQLQWEGANAPFYDTWGEWKRSPWSKAGVTCQDCHGGAEAGRQGFEHSTTHATALSILVDLPQLQIVRGGDPVPLELTLQNTGAGHAYPTGSPFKGVAVVTSLIGPPADKSKAPTVVIALEEALQRKAETVAPYNIIDDTRIEAGGTRTYEAALSLPHEAPTGAWSLHVQLFEMRGGKRTEVLLRETVLPVDVE